MTNDRPDRKIKVGLVCFEVMAVSGFEGFEKRLELQFSGDDPVAEMGGLRQLEFEVLEEVLHEVQCTVVAAVGNTYFDSYVLSESSLFVYPTKIIIKTCGTTQLLKSVRPLVHLASRLGLSATHCRYTRGNFIFPKAQPYPHTSFKEEVLYLEQQLPTHLCYTKASLMHSKLTSHSWHVFTASNNPRNIGINNNNVPYTIEVCMTELDRLLARNFFTSGKPTVGRDMTDLTGIREINPNATICDFAFDPCGYSMNGVDGERYSTIHVTPEDGFSYASFECVGDDDRDDIAKVLRKVVEIFRPGTMSVSITSATHEAWTAVAKAVEGMGMRRRSCTVDEFPAAGTVMFQTFTLHRKQ
nr:S-adenosylmethionine decarboxylase proenzyme 4-like [Ipomoea batatas]